MVEPLCCNWCCLCIYFNKKYNSVDLQPDNPKFKTLHYPASEVEIVGKVIKKDEPIISKKRRENK